MITASYLRGLVESGQRYQGLVAPRDETSSRVCLAAVQYLLAVTEERVLQIASCQNEPDEDNGAPADNVVLADINLLTGWCRWSGGMHDVPRFQVDIVSVRAHNADAYGGWQLTADDLDNFDELGHGFLLELLGKGYHVYICRLLPNRDYEEDVEVAYTPLDHYSLIISWEKETPE